MLKRFIQILALATSLTLVACNGTNNTTGSTSDDTSAPLSYAGTYNGSITGVNAGPATIVVSSSNVVTGTWTITNRDADGGPFPITFKGTVDSSGKLTADALWISGELVMLFSGNISTAGELTGTYFEPEYPNRPDKAGAFTMSRVGGALAGGGSTSTSKSGCTGSYTGSIEAPEQSVRLANRDRQLAEGGELGGGVDGGIYLEGGFAWETDANCRVIKGTATIFGHEFPIDGVVNTDKTFTLNYFGPIVGSVDGNNKITGQLKEGGKEWVHGVLNGTFTPNGKI